MKSEDGEMGHYYKPESGKPWAQSCLAGYSHGSSAPSYRHLLNFHPELLFNFPNFHSFVFSLWHFLDVHFIQLYSKYSPNPNPFLAPAVPLSFDRLLL